jgi:hypothetical protein
MKIIKLNEREYKIPENWLEVTLKTYVAIANLEETRSQYILGELYLLKMIEAICGVESGELDDLELSQVEDISNTIAFIKDEYKWENNKTLLIEDKTYVFPQNLNKLTMGEYISLKTFQENAKSQADAIPYILAIILRPGVEVKNEETGEVSWKAEKFTIENLEWRKDIFMDQPVVKLLGPVSFFLTGKE